MAAYNHNKPPPEYKKGDNYGKWKKRLNIWKSLTSLTKSKQGPAIFESLDEDSQEAALELDDGVITGEDGLNCILKLLDGLYLKAKTKSEFEGEPPPRPPIHIPPAPPPPPPPPTNSAYPILSPTFSPSKKLTFQEEIDKIQLKKVKRSPGGTPLKGKSEYTNPTDMAAILAEAMKKRFASMNVDSRDAVYSKDDFSDDDDLFTENVSYDKHDSSKQDLSHKNHNMAEEDVSGDKHESAEEDVNVDKRHSVKEDVNNAKHDSAKEDVSEDKQDSAKEDVSEDNQDSTKEDVSDEKHDLVQEYICNNKHDSAKEDDSDDKHDSVKEYVSNDKHDSAKEDVSEDNQDSTKEDVSDEKHDLVQEYICNNQHNSAKEDDSDDKHDSVKEYISNDKHDSAKEDVSEDNQDSTKEDVSDEKHDLVQEYICNNKHDSAKEDDSDDKHDSVKEYVSNDKHDSAKEDVGNDNKYSAKENIIDDKYDSAEEDVSDDKYDSANEDVSEDKHNSANEDVSDDEHDSDKEDISEDKNNWAKDILRGLCLEEVLSYNFGLKDISIMKSSLEMDEPQTLRDKILFIISKIIALDFRSRNIQLSVKSDQLPENTESLQYNEIEVDENYEFESMLKELGEESQQTNDIVLHPSDIIVIIMNCCDNFLRKVLIQKMAICQLAVPLVLPILHNNKKMFLLDAMRFMNLNVKTDSTGVHDVNKIDIPSSIVSTIRIGELSRSKSKILNTIICDHPHGIFFHKDCERGNVIRKISNGVIELAWYIPGGRKQSKQNTEDHFDNVMAFANLRGDAIIHSKQVELLSKISSVMLVFVSVQSISDDQCHAMLKKLSYSKQELIFIFLDGISQQCLITLKELMGNAKFKIFLGSVKGIVKNYALLTTDLRGKIKDSLITNQGTENNEEHLNWETISNLACDFGIQVDENDEFYKKGKIMANSIMDKLDFTNVTTIKNDVVPLQGTFWSDWSSLSKKQNRLNGVLGNDLNTYISDIIIQKGVCRNEQLKLIDEMNPAMKSFIKTLIQTKDNPDSQNSFVQWIKFKLDINSYKNLPELQKNYSQLWNDIQYKKYKKTNDSENETTDKLLQLETDLIASSFGLEHFMRELGQVYEAVIECEDYSSDISKNSHLLPRIAADLLISGFPLEIMDGNVAHIPLIWVNAVFDSLKSKLHDKKVYVISVLGVQSSGKSTLLNTMFGLNFAVSAGRCTKGVFAQLIPVDNSLSDKLGYDYILVLDTEGLRAPELGKTKHNHDNELATLVIGLGDVTIVNIKGENMAEMEDILEICVHAFLRMQLTNNNLKLQPGCYFIHQNVPAVDAHEKMKHGYQKILEKLDVIAVAAAMQEGAREIRSFNDVIDFDVNNNVFYFSSLWKGDPPMAPANPSYSEKVLDLKSKLLNYPSEKNINCLSFSDLQLRIADLWNALLFEDFVFSFRNSLEVNSYNYLEKTFSSLSWSFRSEVKKWTSGSVCEILSCEENNVVSLQSAVINSLGIIIDNNLSKYRKALDKCFTSSKDKDILVKWKGETDIRLRSLSHELKREAKKTCLSHFEIRRAQFVKENQTELNQKRLNEYVKEFVKELDRRHDKDELKEMSDESLEEVFAKKWNEWMDMLSFEKIKEENIVGDVLSVLRDNFKANRALLQKVAPSDDSLKSENGDLHIQSNIDFKIPDHKIKFGQAIKDPIPEIKTLTTTMLREINKQINENKHQNYDKDIIYDIINKVDENIKSFNTDKPYEFQINYNIKVTVYMLREIIPLLEKRHRQFIKKNDPQHFLEENVKPQHEIYFIGAVSQCKMEQTAADTLNSFLEKAIIEKVERDIPQFIAENIKGANKEFETKISLYSKVLEYLGTEKSFDKYIEFINNPNAAMSSWLKDYVSNYCSGIKPNGNSNLANEANEILGNTIKTLKKSVNEVNASVDISFHDWLIQYQNIVKRTVSLQNKIFNNLELKELKDKEYFEERIISGIEKLQKKIQKLFSNWSVENLDEKPHLLLSASLLGCTVQCPLCNAICTLNDAGHSGQHSNPQHRPGGIAGYYTTSGLSVETCNLKVAGDSWFRCRDETCKEQHPYKDYASAGPEYAAWRIKPDTSLEGSLYWKWVLREFGEQFVNQTNMYWKEKDKNMIDAKCPTFPATWKSITWHDAKASIGKSVPLGRESPGLRQKPPLGNLFDCALRISRFYINTTNV